MSGIESLGRIRTQGLALLGVAFAAGVLVGVAGDRLLTRPAAAPPPQSFARRPMPPGMLPPFLGTLDLTAEQETAIREILASARPATDSIMQMSMPPLRAVMESVETRIRAVLTPDQRTRLDSLAPVRWRMGPDSGPPFLRRPRSPRPERPPDP